VLYPEKKLFDSLTCTVYQRSTEESCRLGLPKATQWQELRSRLEWGLLPDHLVKKWTSFNFASIRKLSDLTEEEKSSGKRRLNSYPFSTEAGARKDRKLKYYRSTGSRKEQFIEEENKCFEEMLASAVKDCSRAVCIFHFTRCSCLFSASKSCTVPVPFIRKFLRQCRCEMPAKYGYV
jgi:hypothetical protein